MPSRPVLLVPFHADQPGLAQTRSVLDSHQIGHHTETEKRAILERVEHDRPVLVIVQGGRNHPHFVRLVEDVVETGSAAMPVLTLIERLCDTDEAQLLQAGARDVVPAPASPTRLRSRILAMRRHAVGDISSHQICSRGVLDIDLGRREVTVGDRRINLTRSEFDLLVALARDPRRVVTRDELAFHMGPGSSSRAVESHLSRLRHKVVEAQGPRLVESIRGVGYRLGVS